MIWFGDRNNARNSFDAWYVGSYPYESPPARRKSIPVHPTFIPNHKIEHVEKPWLGEPFPGEPLMREVEITTQYQFRTSPNGTFVDWNQDQNITLQRDSYFGMRLVYITSSSVIADDEIVVKEEYVPLRISSICLLNNGVEIKWNSKTDYLYDVLKTEDLLANDPLYMLTPNNLPKHDGNNFNDLATNLLHDKFDIDVKYHNGISELTSKVGFRFSVAKPEIQALGGNSAIGKHYHDNTGISFVRAGREIDFGRFGFIDASDPRHRWWGVEIRFEPALDELFEITNNKQHVRGIHSLDSESMAEHIEEAKERNYKSAMLVQINKLVKEHIAAMMVIIKGRGTGNRSQTNRVKAGLKDRVNKVVEKSNINTESGDRANKLTEDQKIEERVSLLLKDDSSLDEASAKEIAKESIDYKIDIQSDTWPGNLFLDRRAVANASVGIVNRNTKFYDDFWSYLQEHDDKKGFEALEVMMMALIRSEDELALEYDKKMFETYRAKWGEWIEKLLDQAT